jgi:CheY-like chemotaxis protein
MAKVKILIVDDGIMVVNMLRLWFQKEGREIISCSSGEEAISLIESGLLPDACIFDFHFNGKLNGGTLREFLGDTLPETTYFLITSDGEATKSLEGFNGGIFIKPLKMIAFANAVEAVFKKEEV